jgi:hypothetical protein
MDRSINKKRKLESGNESRVARSSSGSITHSAVGIKSEAFVRQYNEAHFLSDSFHLEKSSHVLCVACG